MEPLECPNALAKQVLSQLSYTPTARVTFILKHFRARRNPFLCFSVITVPNCTETFLNAVCLRLSYCHCVGSAVQVREGFTFHLQLHL
jgi:hypothetical protein